MFCDGWHTSRIEKELPEIKKNLLEEFTWKTKEQPEGLDVSTILKLDIPDLAQVYGGFRGRTMSSRQQAHAWPVLIKSGIKQLIDLREADKSERLPNLCQLHGLEYFHYPVDNHARTIAQMVELFPKFCEQIDKGNFYIACAMGLHRTDIALCTYWVFYAADKGIAPPPIRGYRQEDGHNTNKIMRVLNAFYQHKTEIEGKEPMPIDVFKERKKVINELSKN